MLNLSVCSKQSPFFQVWMHLLKKKKKVLLVVKLLRISLWIGAHICEAFVILLRQKYILLISKLNFFDNLSWRANCKNYTTYSFSRIHNCDHSVFTMKL